MNIAITGGTGFIGKYFVQYATQNLKDDIYLIARKSSDLSALRNHKIKLVLYDGTFASLNDFFGKNKVDLVVHLGGFTRVEHKPDEVDEIIDSNIKFSCQLLEAANLNGCKHFINCGTYVQNYFSEEYYPSCLYAASKQSVQNIIDYYTEIQKMSAITLKIFTAYGPLDQKNIFNLFKKSQQSGEKIKMSPGEQEIRFTYIDDIIEAFKIAMKLIKKTSGHQIYYVGSKAYQLKEAARIFEEVSGKKLNIEWGALPYRKNQPLKSYIGRLLPGFKSKVDLKEGIKNLNL